MRYASALVLKVSQLLRHDCYNEALRHGLRTVARYETDVVAFVFTTNSKDSLGTFPLRPSSLGRLVKWRLLFSRTGVSGAIADWILMCCSERLPVATNGMLNGGDKGDRMQYLFTCSCEMSSTIISKNYFARTTPRHTDEHGPRRLQMSYPSATRALVISEWPMQR